MSGTAYGTVVLHACPEAAAGGPLALVENGDLITLDVNAGVISMDVDDKTLAQRRKLWKPAHPQATRGYVKMYQETVGRTRLEEPGWKNHPSKCGWYDTVG